MARRRRLEAPDAGELEEFEAGFAAKPAPDGLGVVAPIAQVSAEAARTAEPGDVAARVAVAETRADAASWRAAQGEGRVVERLALDVIEAEHLVRDRVSWDRDEMDELKASLCANGLRLPIEVTPLADARFGLISGWRRVAAFKALRAEGKTGFETIAAIVRPPRDAGAAYAAMVEENEIRAQLTPYERGRIAAVTAGQGAFAGIEDAVAGLYAASSKAKRSKIRSFALVHEELGDLLSFPTALSERGGLRLATAIRDGWGERLRAALATGMGVDPAEEWAQLEAVLAEYEAEQRPEPARGGRPRKAPRRRVREGEIALANGITMERVSEEDGFSIKFRGRAVDVDLMDAVMLEIKRLLEPI